MMTFTSSTYEGLVTESSASQSRLFPQYQGSRNDFDIIIIGSGIGGGVLADALADQLGTQKRILVVEAGSYLFPTHVFNICRFPNADVARNFGCKTFWQQGGQDGPNYIHERPQLNFGGRSIFWSGLIPRVQPWELEFFPKRVRDDLNGGLLDQAGQTMNESVTMGAMAQAVVKKLRESELANDFEICETPRALHQPYLTREAVQTDRYSVEPTGVFNTAELLINQAGLPSGANGDGPGLRLLLNHYVEDVQNAPWDRFRLVTRNTLSGHIRTFEAGTVVLAGGSIESPKLLRRSSLFHSLPDSAKPLVGRGLTDHPTTDWVRALATSIGGLELRRDDHAKIAFYSRGRRDAQNRILYPFNVEMNINHEYWHLRENDPGEKPAIPGQGNASIVEIKFSFGNCLDDANEIKPAPPYGYVPEVAFKNLHRMEDLAKSRFPALAGWEKSYDEIFAVLNEVTYKIFFQFRNGGREARPEREEWNGQNGIDFGLGTVHHAVGTLRMPHRRRLDTAFEPHSVVDEDLRVAGTRHLYVCDMSVMPFSSAANPVRTLVALALRLSKHFGA